MGLIDKFLRMLDGKAQKAIEDATDPLEQIYLNREEFVTQVEQVNEAKTKIIGELKLAQKDLKELNTEVIDNEKTLNGMKDYVKAGNTLSLDDKTRGQKLMAKQERLADRIKLQEAEIAKIEKVKDQIEQRAADLELKLDEVNDKIEDAERTAATSKATTSYAKALEIVNDDTSAKSLDTQLHKLDREASVAEAKAEVAEQKSDNFDFERQKKSNSFDEFLNS